MTATVRPGANLTNIDVWDGPNRVARFGGIKLFGEHRFKLDTNPYVISVARGFLGHRAGSSHNVQPKPERVNRVAGAQNLRNS